MSRAKSEALRAAIYCRISLAKWGDTRKIEDQEEDCRGIVERRGWTLDPRHVFKDPSRSAWQRNRKRPGWESLLEAVDRGEIDAIVVYHGDRLIRQPWDLEQLLRLADQRGIRLASVQGERNLDNPDDRFILRIEAAAACRESDSTSRRQARALRKRAERGQMARYGGTRSFGYRTDMTIEPEEARIVREIAKRLIHGQSLGTVRRWLTETGVPTVTGARWSTITIRQMMSSPRIAGLAAHKGEILGPGTWDGVINRATWEAVQAALAVRARSRTGDVVATNRCRHLLSGIALCGTCRKPMLSAWQTRAGADQVRLYRCVNPDCTLRVSRAADDLDDLVIGYMLRRSREPLERGAADGDAGFEDIALRIGEVERRREEAVASFSEDPNMPPALLQKMLARFEEQLADLREQREAATRTLTRARHRNLSLAEWEGLPLSERRAAIESTVTVTVLPVGGRRRARRALPIEETVRLDPKP
jgi:DNA invertase Pin-like site-specific DNA recombinase